MHAFSSTGSMRFESAMSMELVSVPLHSAVTVKLGARFGVGRLSAGPKVRELVEGHGVGRFQMRGDATPSNRDRTIGDAATDPQRACALGPAAPGPQLDRLEERGVQTWELG